ncbi:MAG: outer membrane lipoprotein chaperone LolA [Gammaproteobacteria bacterium]|nr:outer membrane lipoprotein chaperone LolA [Gammaproteobacteria bacterium]
MQINGQEESPQTPLHNLVATLAETSSIKADVEQLILSQDGRQIQALQAVLIMQKPDLLNWHVIEPYEELMISDGESLWYYEPDLEQVSIQDFPDDVENNPILLLNDDLQAISEAYEVSLGYVDEEVKQYVLLPLTASSSYERFSMTFSGVDLLQMQFESSVGQLTSFSFTNIINNAVIDPAEFSFAIPTDIEVIDSRQIDNQQAVPQ